MLYDFFILPSNLRTLQCGHQAILHKPANAAPHIDFVVGDHVECYEGTLATAVGDELAWPSRLSGVADCEKHSAEQHRCATNSLVATAALATTAQHQHVYEQPQDEYPSDLAAIGCDHEDCVLVQQQLLEAHTYANPSKVYHLDELDLSGGEWDWDFEQQPQIQPLLGLCKWNNGGSNNAASSTTSTTPTVPSSSFAQQQQTAGEVAAALPTTIFATDTLHNQAAGESPTATAAAAQQNLLTDTSSPQQLPYRNDIRS